MICPFGIAFHIRTGKNRKQDTIPALDVIFQCVDLSRGQISADQFRRCQPGHFLRGNQIRVQASEQFLEIGLSLSCEICGTGI